MITSWGTGRNQAAEGALSKPSRGEQGVGDVYSAYVARAAAVTARERTRRKKEAGKQSYKVCSTLLASTLTSSSVLTSPSPSPCVSLLCRAGLLDSDDSADEMENDDAVTHRLSMLAEGKQPPESWSTARYPSRSLGHALGLPEGLVHPKISAASGKIVIRANESNSLDEERPRALPLQPPLRPRGSSVEADSQRTGQQEGVVKEDSGAEGSIGDNDPSIVDHGDVIEEPLPKRLSVETPPMGLQVGGIQVPKLALGGRSKTPGALVP